jgi:hypothetical protein
VRADDERLPRLPHAILLALAQDAQRAQRHIAHVEGAIAVDRVVELEQLLLEAARGT